MATAKIGLEEDGSDDEQPALERLTLDPPSGGESGEMWNLFFECKGAPRQRDFIELGLDRADISLYNLIRLQDQMGYSVRDYIYYKKRCGRDAASLELVDTQQKAQAMIEENKTEKRVRLIMTKEPLIELHVSISPLKRPRERVMDEEPDVDEDIDEYKLWLEDMQSEYPELGYKDDYRQATIKTYKAWLTHENKLPDEPSSGAHNITEDGTHDRTTTLTKWPSHARRPKEQVNGVSGQAPKKRGRGPLKGLSAAYKRIKSGSQKLQIQFSSRLGGPIGINCRSFVDEVSMFTKMRAPLIGVKSWKDIKENVKHSIASDVMNKWDLLNTDNPEQKIWHIASDRYKGWRGTLSATYKAYQTDVERMKHKPEDVDTLEWYYLLKYFATDEFKKLSRKNTGCRQKKQTEHCMGSKPFSQRSFEQRDPVTGEEPNDIELWLSTHSRNGKWANTASQDVYDNAISILSQRETEQQRDNFTREEKNDIFQKTYKEVIGCKTTRIHGHGYMAKYPTRAQLLDAQIEYSRVSAASKDKCKELEAKVQNLEEQLAGEANERERFGEEIRRQIQEEEQIKRDELKEKLKEELREEMLALVAAGQQSNPPSNTELALGKKINENQLARNLFNSNNGNATPIYISADQLRRSARPRRSQDNTN